MSYWKRRNNLWYETKIINCNLCGQMIPKDTWVAIIDGEGLTFCSPDCEKMYKQYWAPKYGTSQQ